MNELKLTKTEVDNLIHNPNITLVVGQRDYVKELLHDWKLLNTRAIDPRLKEAVEEFQEMLARCDKIKHEWQYQTMLLVIENLEDKFSELK